MGTTEPGKRRAHSRAGRLAALVVTCLLPLSAVGPAFGHWVSAEEVMSRIGASANRARFGVVGVARDPSLPRLLLVQVDERWRGSSYDARRAAAEHWRELWREATASGLVAITDPSGRSLVSFDGHGSAVVKRDPSAGES